MWSVWQKISFPQHVLITGVIRPDKHLESWLDFDYKTGLVLSENSKTVIIAIPKNEWNMKFSKKFMEY